MVAAISAVLLVVWLALFAVFLGLGGDPDVTDFELGHDTVITQPRRELRISAPGGRRREV